MRKITMENAYYIMGKRSFTNDFSASFSCYVKKKKKTLSKTSSGNYLLNANDYAVK